MANAIDIILATKIYFYAPEKTCQLRVLGARECAKLDDKTRFLSGLNVEQLMPRESDGKIETTAVSNQLHDHSDVWLVV